MRPTHSKKHEGNLTNEELISNHVEKLAEWAQTSQEIIQKAWNKCSESQRKAYANTMIDKHSMKNNPHHLPYATVLNMLKDCGMSLPERPIPCDDTSVALRKRGDVGGTLKDLTKIIGESSDDDIDFNNNDNNDINEE